MLRPCQNRQSGCLQCASSRDAASRGSALPSVSHVPGALSTLELVTQTLQLEGTSVSKLCSLSRLPLLRGSDVFYIFYI